MVRDPKNDHADAVQADTDAKPKASKIDAKYNRWEENRMHGEREMESKALGTSSDQLLPD